MIRFLVDISCRRRAVVVDVVVVADILGIWARILCHAMLSPIRAIIKRSYLRAGINPAIVEDQVTGIGHYLN
jgi:hypothetical protein